MCNNLIKSLTVISDDEDQKKLTGEVWVVGAGVVTFSGGR